MEVTSGQGRICKQLRNILNLKSRDWNWKHESLDRSFWRTRFVSENGAVARQTKQQMTTQKMHLPSLNMMCFKPHKYLTHFLTTRTY